MRRVAPWRAYIYVYICMQVCKYLHIYLYRYTDIHTYISNKNIHIDPPTWYASSSALARLYICIYVCVHVCMYVCIYIYIDIPNIYICTYHKKIHIDPPTWYASSSALARVRSPRSSAPRKRTSAVCCSQTTLADPNSHRWRKERRRRSEAASPWGDAEAKVRAPRRWRCFSALRSAFVERVV